MGENSVTTSASSPSTSTVRRCLLLSKSDQPIHPQLLKHLHQRGIETLVVHDEPAVMASLSLDQPVMLILHEPAHWPDCIELREAMVRYYPRIACWQFDATGRSSPLGLTPWRNIKTMAVVTPSPAPVEPVMNQPERDPRAPLLTREEIEMLLGHDPAPGNGQSANQQRPQPANHDDDGL